MAAHRKDPLRIITKRELQELKHISRSQVEASSRVAHAKTLLAVHDGHSYTEAAHLSGRKSNDAVAHLVSRFNKEGLRSLDIRHGGGNPVVYDDSKRRKIVELARSMPDREKDGTATWSLTTLQASLRKQKDLRQVSTFTIGKSLHDAGLSWQESRTWIDTGFALRKRKDGAVVVEDIDKDVKKSSSRKPTH